MQTSAGWRMSGDPGHRQPASRRGAGRYPPGHRARLRGRRAGQAVRRCAEDRRRSARLAAHPVHSADGGGDQARGQDRAAGGAGGSSCCATAPSTGRGASDFLLEMLRTRQLPVIGGGTGVWSFIEITDAAAATLAAVERGRARRLQRGGQRPAPVAQWLPYLAEVAGAKPPQRVPAWLGRLLAGEFAVAQMTTSAGTRTRRPGRSSAGSRASRAGGRGSVPGSADETDTATCRRVTDPARGACPVSGRG